MGHRLELDEILKSIPNIKKVYYQPPESVKLEYPCIIYHLQSMDTRYANNFIYKNRDYYNVMIIDRNPDSNIRYSIEKLPLVRFERFFTADNMNHWVYDIYY